MKKLGALILILFFVVFGYGIFIAVSDIQIVPPNASEPHPQFWDYRGITHVVTKHTRGSLFPKDILIEAEKSDVDFLFLTDLNLLNRPYSIHGYHGDVFTFTNQKISYDDAHILVYSKNVDFTFPSIMSGQSQVTSHLERTNLDSEPPFEAVLAHPLKPNHEWKTEIPLGMDGLEVLNLRKLWQELWIHHRGNFLLSILLYPFNPKLALMRILMDPSEELKLWDALNGHRPTFGILGSETTARIFHLVGLNFSFPSYAESFRFASNHILLESELTGVESRDRDKIFSAFRKGQLYFALDVFGSTKGFGAYIKKNKEIWMIGEQVSLSKGLVLKVDLPGKIRVPWEVEYYRNGKRIFVSKKRYSELAIKEPGNYRIRVRIQPKLPFPEGARWFSWIYTNNFHVVPSAE